jgi:phenylalanyl-tRNA synthetase beta chain
LRTDAIRKMLGIEIAAEEIERIFIGLGFDMESGAEDGVWRCTAPSWRFDMGCEADLIEVIARIHGYDNIPVEPLRGAATARPLRESQTPLDLIKHRLVSRGFSEAITFSFISPELQQLIDPDIAPISLRNPISSDLAVMRTSLIPGLLGTAAHNIARQQNRIRMFESGLRFLPGAQYQQKPGLAMLLCGSRHPESWQGKSQPVDFFDMKGEIDDGQTAEILLGEEVVGVLGRIHPSSVQQLDLPTHTYVAELDLEPVSRRLVPAFRDISRFPEVRRDIAVTVSKATPAMAVLDCAADAAGQLLGAALIFDVYEGDGVADTEKSLAIGLTFRDQSRTLTDEEVNATLQQVIESLSEKLDARLRH